MRNDPMSFPNFRNKMAQGSTSIDRWRIPIGFAIAKVILHIPFLGRYGIHGDELYFLACGSRPALGYVDHPPLVPMVAALARLFGGHSLVALRIPSVLAGAVTVLITVRLAQELGGQRFSAWVAGIAMLAAPMYLRMNAILCIPAFEVAIAAVGAWLLLRALANGRAWQWAALGAVGALGLLAKHSMIFWLLGVAVGVSLTPQARRQGGWLIWLGAGIALLGLGANLLWQIPHGWPSLEFYRLIRQDQLMGIPPWLFLLGQLVYLNPISAPLWLSGLWAALQRSSGNARVLGIAYLVWLAILLVTRAKPYYLAPAYPPLIAFGAVASERWISRRSVRAAAWARRGLVAGLTASGIACALIALPVLPLPVVDGLLRPVVAPFGVRPMDLTFEHHLEFGWAEERNTVSRAFRALSQEDQRHCVILAKSYTQAAALEYFAWDGTRPPIVSGHMTYYLWGPGPFEPETVLAVGFEPMELRRTFAEVVEVARVGHPLAVDSERYVGVHVCRGLLLPWRQAWPSFKRFRFGPGL